MYLKTIRIVFISFLLVINAYAYYLFYSPNEPVHQGYIPANSLMVFTVNSREIGGKLIYSALFQKQDFSELIEDESESDVSWADNINNGLNLLSKITFTLMPVTDSMKPVTCIFADVASKIRLEKFIESKESEKEDLGEGMGFALQGPQSAIAFNDEIAIFLNGDISNEQMKDLSVNLLSKKFPLRPAKSDELYPDADFSVGIHPGIRKPDEVLSLRAMIQSFIHSLYFSGDFGSQSLSMQYVIETDSAFVPVASDVFPKHEHLATVPEELKEGIFRMQLTINPAKWITWMHDANLIQVPDSLKKPVYDGLGQSIGEHFLIRMDAMKLIRILTKKDSAHENSRLIPVPEFSIAFSLLKREPVINLFERMRADSLLEFGNGLYKYKLPYGNIQERTGEDGMAVREFVNEYYYFFIGKSSIVMATDTSRAIEAEFEFHGVSNWFYFNVKNALDAMPQDDLTTSLIADMMAEVATVHYGYGYSTGTDKNRVNFVGKIFYNDPEKHSLIESIKFINNSMAVFMSMQTVVEPE